MKSKKKTESNTNNRIRDWKGLLHEESRKLKVQVFVALLVVGSAMTFTQLGFIGVGANGAYVGYAMGLLVPVVATSMLLGKGAGTLQGLLCGTVLYVHTHVQPLNPVEAYFVSSLNSIGLFAYAGFLIGLFLAIALHNGPSLKCGVAYTAIASLATSVLVTLHFLIGMFIHILVELVSSSSSRSSSNTVSPEWVGAIEATGSLEVQVLLDFALIFATILLAHFVVYRFVGKKGRLSVHTSFGTQLFVVVFLVFCVLSALSYAFITLQIAGDMFEDMTDDMNYIGNQFAEASANLDRIMQSKEVENLSDEMLENLFSAPHLDALINGYNLQRNGTVVVFYDDVVAYSNSPAYPEDKTVKELFGEDNADYLVSLAESGAFKEVLYDTKPFADGDTVAHDDYSTAELGYMRVLERDGFYIMLAKPFSLIFANRQATMTWSTVLSFLLLTVVYVLTAKLLGKNVVGPIDRTNESLAQITDGNLDVQVNERDNVEFASLSDGINTTVGALKGYIAEAETRMERELATAKAIQKSALPRVFPPFPEVDKFDIFASMNAAKEVGGDFYDYFLIDDHTLGFLIADVSGKGVPGALFMMAAKTELENYMSTGMELSQAIATANKRLCANNDAGMFVTVWAATLNYNTGELTYVNAGHNFPLLRHGFNGEWEWLKKKCGLFLGTFETAKYRQQTIMLEPGDELLLYTDGVNEAFNVDEQEYGNDRLEAFVAAHSNMHSREVVRSLRADVARWAEGAEQSDDVTILALEYGVAPEVTGSVTVDAVIENLGVATSLVNNELDARLCPVGVQHKVEVALEELFVNVCRYAYAGKDKPGTVQVRYAYGTNPSSITVELRDKGVPFDPIKRQDPTRPSSVQDAGIGGLGIFMVKNTMDDFTYMRSGDTNVTIIKKGW